jgi:hypothetical protein
LLYLPGQDAVQAEAGGRVGGLAEDGGGEAGPEGRDSYGGVARSVEGDSEVMKPGLAGLTVTERKVVEGREHGSTCLEDLHPAAG